MANANRTATYSISFVSMLVLVVVACVTGNLVVAQIICLAVTLCYVSCRKADDIYRILG